jgi:capsular polysaccharide transport system permease protein
MLRPPDTKPSPAVSAESSVGAAATATAGGAELPVPAAMARATTIAARRRIAAPAGFGPRPRLSLPWLSFAMVVMFPVLVAGIYYFFIAADQYVVEFRLALRSAQPPTAQFAVWLPTTETPTTIATDSYIVVQYIRSRAIVDDLGPTLDLRKMFSAQLADWPARLHLPATVERLVRYWRGQVDAFFDASNGTIVVRARAFSRRDALALAQGILGLSERLVNQLSERARENALRDADAEVARAQRRLTDALYRLRDYRDAEGLVDPNEAANATEKLAEQVREALVGAETELSTLRRYVGEGAPTVRLLEARIQSLEQQDRILRSSITETANTRSQALSRVMGRYEELESERRFAEHAYEHALDALDQARLNADRQQIYIADFIPPGLPEEALYPRRGRSLAIVLLIAFSVWAIGGLTVRSLRDHL